MRSQRLIKGCTVGLMFSVLSAAMLSPVAARADEPKPVAIHVYPADVKLNTNRDRQSFIVQAQFADGLTRDVTAEAKITLANAALVRMEKNVLYPAADGTSELTVQYQGLKQTIPIEVKDAGKDRPISFKLDLMPVFMKAGCNTGSCHGAARGKDGFRLSLFGFDPNGDHYRLTREVSGRRINLALPHESLMMQKTSGEVPHTGGKRFSRGNELYDTLIRWLEAGAPADKGEVPKIVSVDLYPKGAVLDGDKARQRLTVRARYSDGTDRDVTSLAFFMTSNDTSATVSQQGIVEAHERGEAFIMARFETHTVGSHFVVLPKGLKFQWPDVPEYNYIDTLIHHKLRKLRIVPSEICTDEEFLRRVYLNVVGNALLQPVVIAQHRLVTHLPAGTNLQQFGPFHDPHFDEFFSI